MPSPVKRGTEPLTGRKRPEWDLTMSVDILEDIADGKTLKEATSPAVPGRVKASTFLYWCMRVPELQEAYRMARELSGHMLEDEALTVARRLPNITGAAPEMSARIRALDVLINHLRWAAGKRHPREFGDKAQTTFAVPIQINTTIPLGLGEKGELPGVEGREEFLIEVKAEAPSPAPSADIYGAKADEEGAEGVRGRGWNLNRDRPEKGKANPLVRAAKLAEWARRSPEERGSIMARVRAARGRMKEERDAEATRTVRGDTLDGCQERDGVDGVSQPPVEEAGAIPRHNSGVGGEGDKGLPDPGSERE